MKDETSVRAEIQMRASTAVEARLVAGDSVLRTFALVDLGGPGSRAVIYFDSPEDMDRLAAALVATAAEFRSHRFLLAAECALRRARLRLAMPHQVHRASVVWLDAGARW